MRIVTLAVAVVIAVSGGCATSTEPKREYGDAQHVAYVRSVTDCYQLIDIMSDAQRRYNTVQATMGLPFARAQYIYNVAVQRHRELGC